MILRILTSLFVVLLAQPAWSTTYSLVQRSSGGFGVTFSIGYTGGVHNGSARSATGAVNINTSNFSLSSGGFVVPIANMTSGDSKRDCHMRESLGLNYETSGFPEEHVCDSNHRLPSTGPNAIAYPEIKLALTSIQKEGTGTLESGSPVTVTANGQWNIHGVTRPATLKLTLQKQSNGQVRVRGNSQFSLKAFGIHVKKFLFISTKDTAKVSFDLLMAPTQDFDWEW